ncbi:MAG TPA: mechanosensitive ion channel family protein, partial [Tabrizicola sp.]|nr:mechanosensitive ion channel family protein [Tabrizicola sp.]
MRQLARLLLVVLALVAGPLAAQDLPGPQDGQEVTVDGTALNYNDWDRMALRAEAEIGERRTSTDRLDEIRAHLAQWRAALLTAQNANSARIATLREQIAALGPAPA